MPSYTQDEFFRLIAEVEAQGGDLVDATHDIIVHEELAMKGDKEPVQQNCGEAALVDVPYEPMGDEGTLAMVRLCAIDDRIGLMPRFALANAPGSPK